MCKLFDTLQTQKDPAKHDEDAVEPPDDMIAPESTSGKQASGSCNQAQAPRKKPQSQKRMLDGADDDEDMSSDEEEEDTGRRCFSKSVTGKAASAVRELAAQVYGKMVDDCRDKSTSFESLKAGDRYRDDMGG
ncbi:TPA: hypothetical protein ACH3X1_001158 [Trebouxia sp. C0004]